MLLMHIPITKKEGNLMDELKGKIVIVTGGASGIGRALCEELGKNGAVVTIADLNAEGAKQVANKINENGGQAHYEQLNVTQAEEVKKVIEGTYSAHGRLDYIFNNAGRELAECNSMSGREEEARYHVAEGLKNDPNWSLEMEREIYSYKNPADLERHLDALRKAGLPEHPPKKASD
jgi:NAD(P)-dependent dehydrogenase (short-subunit alcohol dehydrogenase family)